MSTQHMTLSWTRTTLVALAEEKLILPLLTMNQSKLCGKIQIRHVWYSFERVFWAKKLILWRVKSNVLQTTLIIRPHKHMVQCDQVKGACNVTPL